jgi:hypothetical protein
MREVYKYAAFCIAATASKNCHSGLFVDRDLEDRTPVKVHFTGPRLAEGAFLVPDGDYALITDWISPAYNIDDAPLNRRAWV